MSTHNHTRRRDRHQPRAAAPSYPDARAVGPHLVIDRTEWVPGHNPETHLAHDGQRGYAESYYRCLRCGAERQSTSGFPPACAATH